MPRRARDALKKADLQLVDTLEHRMLTALAEAEDSAVRLTGDSAEVPAWHLPLTMSKCTGTC